MFYKAAVQRGGLQGKELRSPAAGNKAQLGGEKASVCLSECELGVGGWGGQEAVFQAMELHYKKFDIKKHGRQRSNVLRCCLPEKESL